MLYDLDVLYEDKPSDLKDEIENSLDKKKAYFIEKNETLVVFFRERFYEDVKNVIYEKWALCQSVRMKRFLRTRLSHFGFWSSSLF